MESLIIKRKPEIRAKFTPRPEKEIFTFLEHHEGEFTFVEIRPVGKERKFESRDKNFPASFISEHDLTFIKDENKTKQT